MPTTVSSAGPTTSVNIKNAFGVDVYKISAGATNGLDIQKSSASAPTASYYVFDVDPTITVSNVVAAFAPGDLISDASTNKS